MAAFLFLFLSLLFTVISQVLQKRVADASPRGRAQWQQRLHGYCRQPRFWLALVSLFAAMLCWLVVLDIMDVGKAYPILSLNYVLMLLVSGWLFGEVIPGTRWLGVVLVMAGIALISGS